MKKLIGVALAVGASLNCHAQLDSLFIKLVNEGFGIRKTFDGSSKDEAKPATFFFNRDFRKNVNFYTIDVAVKLTEFELLKHSSSVLVLVPKFEYHLNSQDENDKNIASGGVNVEFIPFLPKVLGPMFIASADYQNDNVVDLETVKLKGFLSLTGTPEGMPGTNIRNKKKVIIFRYYPYTGFERYVANTESSLSANYWGNRLFFELWPFPVKDKTYLQLTFDYTHRTDIDDDLVNKGSIEWLSIGVNYFPDGKGKLGIGMDYSSGDDATTDFLFVRRINFGLKLKL